MATKSLWGEIPHLENLRTPYVILKEQASILSVATDGLLIGEVSRNQHKDGTIRIYFQIKAPSLNNYYLTVLQVDQISPAQLYPVRLKSLAFEGFDVDCHTEVEFENTLGRILSSQEVKRVIPALLADIRADQPEF